MTDLSQTRRREFLRHSLVAAAAVRGASLTIGTETPPEKRPEWIRLFDGKTLAGWHTNRKRIGHGTGGLWQVEDGAITGTQKPPGNGGVLLSDAVYGDFELCVSIRPDWGVDSGLFVRSTERGQAFQVAVDHYHGGYIGQIYGEGLGGFNTCSFRITGETDEIGKLTGLKARGYRRPAGADLDYAIAPEGFLQAWKLGGWNALRVRVVGQLPEITTWLNDVKLLAFDASRYKHPRFKPEEVKKIAPRAGHIAFQIHGGTKRWAKGAKCRWKDIRIKTLS